MGDQKIPRKRLTSLLQFGKTNTANLKVEQPFAIVCPVVILVDSTRTIKYLFLKAATAKSTRSRMNFDSPNSELSFRGKSST